MSAPLVNAWLRRAGATFVADPPPRRPRGTIDVSVVIPAYNREHLLPQTLASVAAQSVTPAEVIVVDDGSTDGTVRVAEAHGARVVRAPANGGAMAARRLGLDETTSTWVAMLDSDDEWPPWMLATLWPRRADHDFVAGSTVSLRDGRLVAFEGLPLGWAMRLTSPELLVWPQNLIPASGAIARRTALLKALDGRERFRYSEDFAIWVRILREGTGLVIARPTLRYRVHPGQKSLSLDRYRDQHAIVRDAYTDDEPLGERWLSRRRRLDEWDISRTRPETRGARTVATHVLPPRGQSVLPVVALRSLQHRRARRLTPDLDLSPARWLRDA